MSLPSSQVTASKYREFGIGFRPPSLGDSWQLGGSRDEPLVVSPGQGPVCTGNPFLGTAETRFAPTRRWSTPLLSGGAPGNPPGRPRSDKVARTPTSDSQRWTPLQKPESITPWPGANEGCARSGQRQRHLAGSRAWARGCSRNSSSPVALEHVAGLPTAERGLCDARAAGGVLPRRRVVA